MLLLIERFGGDEVESLEIHSVHGRGIEHLMKILQNYHLNAEHDDVVDERGESRLSADQLTDTASTLLNGPCNTL